MRVNNRLSYYLLLLLFPVSFLLHNVNENFGLTGLPDIAYLLVVYLITGFCISFVSSLILKQYSRAFVFSFILLTINFLFGAYKDFIKDRQLLPFIITYRFILPALFLLLMLIFIYLKKKDRTFARLPKAIAFFLVVNFIVETGWFMFNLITRADVKQDFGDYNHDVIKSFTPNLTRRRPAVFWIVFDEYSNSSTLQKVWGFANPIDSTLRAKGFFIADSARSNYNYTHFSLSSTLDMVYLRNLQNHSVVRLRDLRRGDISIYDNNAVEVFEKNGYAINNFTIFQLKDHPTSGIDMFDYVPRFLINYQTFEGRTNSEIGWNLPNLFKRNKRAADSLVVIKSLHDLDTTFKGLMNRCVHSAQEGAAKAKPSFYLFHFLLPHEPYMYNGDGSIAYKNGYHDSAQHYIPQLQYTNTLITKLTDSILSIYGRKDVAIILQGDHAFKFQENDPLFDQESCKIFYAVYCSDGDYSSWRRSMSSVNGFRILFNKYFQAGFPLLPDTSYNLHYR